MTKRSDMAERLSYKSMYEKALREKECREAERNSAWRTQGNTAADLRDRTLELNDAIRKHNDLARETSKVLDVLEDLIKGSASNHGWVLLPVVDPDTYLSLTGTLESLRKKSVVLPILRVPERAVPGINQASS